MEKLTTEAKAEGIAEGIAEGTLKTLFSLVEDGVISIDDAAKRADMSEVVFKEKIQQFKA